MSDQHSDPYRAIGKMALLNMAAFAARVIHLLLKMGFCNAPKALLALSILLETSRWSVALESMVEPRYEKDVTTGI